MLPENNTVLILAPHTDDGELGCGATIARFTAEGKQVHYAAFSLCEASLPANLPSDTLEKECRIATRILGIDPAQINFYNFPVRQFPAFRQEILEELVALNKKIKPGLVLIPSCNDRHQDHQVIHQEARRAFNKTSLAGYDLPWNNDQFRTDLFITLTEEQLEKKISAILAYQSQKSRTYMQPEFIRSLATVRGLQAGTQYAEGFEIYNWIV